MNFSNVSNINMSDSISGYVTADEDDETDNTHYLSVISPDMSFDGMNITLSNPPISSDETELVEITSEEVGQPFIFTIDGSNEIYGVQIAQDEEGNLQRYQIQYSENMDGELVPMLETIQMLPLEEELQFETNKTEVVGQATNLFEGSMMVNDKLPLIQQNEEGNVKKELSNIEDYNDLNQNEEDANSSLGEILPNSSRYHSVCIKEEKADSLPEAQEDEQSEMTQLNLKSEDLHETLVHITENESIAEHFHIEENCEEQELNEDEQNIQQEQFEQLFVEENHILETADIMENLNRNDSDNEMYHIVDGIHITGDITNEHAVEEPMQAVLQESVELHGKSNILRKPSQNSLLKDHRNLEQKIVYVQTVLEKENMESMKLERLMKPNSRSLLKCNQPIQTQQIPEPIHIEAYDDKYSKRYSRTKEAKQARQFRNFINSTTIPQVPERKQRLPRKQQITPLKHPDEDIVVKEMIVSSKGFVEPISTEEKRCLPVTEYVVLLDSGDESNNENVNRKKKKGKRSQEELIEINTSDSDESNSSVIELDFQKEASDGEKNESSSTVKKKRGRPPKNKQKNCNKDSDFTLESPPKISRTESDVESVTSTLKVIRVENECSENLDINGSSNVANQNPFSVGMANGTAENIIDCQNSSGMDDCISSETDVVTNHPKSIEISANSVNNSTVAENKQVAQSQPKKVFEYKYECEKCKCKFINQFLLSRHGCAVKYELPFSCDSCQKRFPNITSLNVHKKIHAKGPAIASTKIPFGLKAPAKKSEMKNTSKFALDNKKSTSGVPMRKSILPIKTTVENSSKLTRQSCLAPKTIVKTTIKNPLEPSEPASNIAQINFLKPRASSIQSKLGNLLKHNNLKLDQSRVNSGLETPSLDHHMIQNELKTPEKNKSKKLVKPVVKHNGLGATPALTRNFTMLKSRFQ